MTKKQLWMGAALASVVAFAPLDAQAGIEACGNINVSASADCKVEVSGGCPAMCEPINFTASCYADCSGQCNVTADVGCTGSCEADCSGSCEANPGSFDCQASCEGTCGADCEANCSDNQCVASCKATCEGECSGSCQGTPPSATCEAKCSASCQGSCKAEVNADCQVSCQGSCSAELSGGCKAECEKPEGALFCDGQYVDHGGNLEECIAALNAILNVKVDASASASCSGNSCEAEGEVSASCAHNEGPVSPWSAGWAAAFLAGLGVTIRRRRR